MDLLYLWIIFFVILMPLILGIVIPIHKNHKKATGTTVNHDSTMSKFVYKVPLTSDSIINLLKTKNDIDELSCTFDFERSVINFSEYGSNREYYFEIQEYKDFSVLKLEQVALIGMQSAVPYKLNPFMVSKLNAEIVPFSQYSF